MKYLKVNIYSYLLANDAESLLQIEFLCKFLTIMMIAEYKFKLTRGYVFMNVNTTNIGIGILDYIVSYLFYVNYDELYCINLFLWLQKIF